MALQTITQDALVESLFEIIRCHGYEGTTIALLSDITGLKKSSLYHRFPAGKDDMVKAVVLYVSAQLQQLIIAPLLERQVAPEERFSKMLVTVKAFYGGGNKNCLLNVLSLGEAKDDIKTLLKQDYAAWFAALSALAQDAVLTQTEAEVRAEQFLIAVQGALVVQRLTENPPTFDNCMAYAQKQFFKSSDG
ncbi:MAG: TetR/AcrR family transcriptional regulator [Methylococcaceae bacterium]|nr:TetR/AcrR family transcriptional regulator [Methylococcaceae bacterium]